MVKPPRRPLQPTRRLVAGPAEPAAPHRSFPASPGAVNPRRNRIPSVLLKRPDGKGGYGIVCARTTTPAGWLDSLLDPYGCSSARSGDRGQPVESQDGDRRDQARAISDAMTR